MKPPTEVALCLNQAGSSSNFDSEHIAAPQCSYLRHGGMGYLPMARRGTQDSRGPKQRPHSHGANGLSHLNMEAGGNEGLDLTGVSCTSGGPSVGPGVSLPLRDPAAKS